tara:strand:+ start:65033 stop:65236 length:204 start_codon:yes stop_codon:yes gene_type:complete
MSKQERQFLTVGIELAPGEPMPAFVQNLFDRMREYPDMKDGAGVFAASWTNVFDERDRLEDQLSDNC